MQWKYVRSLAIASIFTASAAFAAGTAPRSFVSSTGLDTNPCSRTSPCRSFGAAIAQTATGGTVIALDSAGYGTVAIGQSVSLIAPEGVYAGITGSSPYLIQISGTLATDNVTLRGLTIEGTGANTAGVSIADPIGVLTIDHCVINSTGSKGIDFESSNSGAYMFVADTTIQNTVYGFYTFSSGASVHSYFDHCRAIRCYYGFCVNSGAATATNSVAFGSRQTGFLVQSIAKVSIAHCQATGNDIGIDSETSSIVTVSDCVISDNVTDGINSGQSGLIVSLTGDATYPVKTNVFSFNGTDGSFTGTLVAK